MSIALPGLVVICNFFDETYFCHLHAYFLGCFYNIEISYISYLFSLRRSPTVETIPICKSGEDRADTRFRNS